VDDLAEVLNMTLHETPSGEIRNVLRGQKDRRTRKQDKSKSPLSQLSCKGA